MSHLLDAIAGVPNACEPIPGIVTGGQPASEHLAALKRAGCEVVIDIREATFGLLLDAVRELAGKRSAFVHCSSGNRVGAGLIPYFMLEQGLEEQEAVAQAMRVGLRSAELMEQALEYVRSRQGI